MAVKRGKNAGPRGGIQVNPKLMRGWSWDRRGGLVSKPVRCRKEDWYMARARVNGQGPPTRACVVVRFQNGAVDAGQKCLRLFPLEGPHGRHELVGWIQTPDQATHLQLSLPDATLTGFVDEIVLQDVAERDPKCHPLARVPRWDTLRPPFPLERVFLPAALAGLEPLLDGLTVAGLDAPRSAVKLARRLRGAAGILDPQWARDTRLTLAQLESLARDAWVIVDLETMARLVAASGAADTEIIEHRAENGLMSARVEYADVPTRGFALQDVVPYSNLEADGRFRMRVLRASRSWTRFADHVGFATQLSSETPWERKHGDVLTAMRPVGRGELLTTDLPWLAAGLAGPVVAPRILAHLLRMHLGLPLADRVQYWNRWDSGDVIVRDISDLARRYPPLRPVRWQSAEASLAHLGVALIPPDVVPRRHVLIRTGRIDSVEPHDGVPPEPMQIFMKWLTREWTEQTGWARRHLADTVVTWQFDTRDGVRYAANYDAATPLPGSPPTVVTVRMASESPQTEAIGELVTIAEDEGLHGDRSLAFQDELTGRLQEVLARPH